MSFNVLYGEKVYLRPVSKEDLLKMSKWSEDPEINYLMGQLLEDRGGSQWYTHMLQEKDYRVLAIHELGGVMIGDIELAHIEWRKGQAELIVRIGEKSYWGKGYGSDAVTLMLCHAFKDLGLKELYLRVYSYNRRAIKCYEKCGFKKEAYLQVDKYDGNKRSRTIFLMKILRDEFFSIAPSYIDIAT